MHRYTIALTTLVVVLGATQTSAAPDAFHDAVLADTPVLYYQFNEASGPAINHGSLGSDFDATYFGSPVRTAPTSSGDTGVTFTGIDDYLESLTVAPMALGGNPTFSAEAVVRVPVGGAVANYAPLLHWGDSASFPTMKSVFFSFQFTNPNHFFAGFFNGGLRTASPVELGDWYHVVWVRTGDGAANVGSTFYVNGQVATLEDDPLLGFNTSTPDVVPTEFRINRAQDVVRFFLGTLDEVALYDYELDSEAVATHYAALDVCPLGTCLDADGVCKVCAHPVSTGPSTTATDALAILRAAVGTRDCSLCICDVDASGSTVALDALLALRAAVGEPIPLMCSM